MSELIRETEIYEELWKLCAGPLGNVPSIGDMVFYFPQGHMELLEVSMNQELNQDVPHIDIPSNILCLVANISFMAEKETDEVYAHVTLLPGSNLAQPIIPDEILPEPPKQKYSSFCKILTASDTSTHGGFSILRKHAIECLPPLDMTQTTPTQDLIAKDLHGFEWKFRHVYRGQPKRHLFTTGWSTFVTSKRLLPGDTLVFLRAEDGEMRVGVRRQARHQSPMASSMLSTRNVLLGLLATAAFSIKTHTMFIVCCRPRSTRFLVEMNKYLEAVNNDFVVGKRFTMKFEGEDKPVTRFSGTIVGVGDVSQGWPNSQWRSLMVQWDEPAAIPRPDRVSPWDIEPYVASAFDVIQPVGRGKRSRPVDVSSPACSGFFHQGSSSQAQNLTQLGAGATEVLSKEMQFVCSLRQKDINSHPINANSRSSRIRLEGIGPSSPHFNVTSNIFTQTKSGYPNVSYRPSNGVEDIEMSENTMGCWLFGVNLTNNSSNDAAPLEKELRRLSLTYVPSGPKESVPAIACETERVQTPNYSLSNKRQKQIISDASPNEWQNKQASVPFMRTRIKVQMQGVAVGRAFDLTTLNGYDDLIDELEKLFDIKGELRLQNKWAITFADDENDIMQVGDDRWEDFCNIVKKIFICSREDMKKIKCKGGATSSEVEEILFNHRGE